MCEKSLDFSTTLLEFVLMMMDESDGGVGRKLDDAPPGEGWKNVRIFVGCLHAVTGCVGWISFFHLRFC